MCGCSGMTELTFPEKEAEEAENVKLSFHPPVYVQRYLAVTSILGSENWKNKISKVVDFGCSELKLFKYLKRVKNVTHVCAVDIEENLILNNLHEVEPLIIEFISNFNKRLTVELFAGSIEEPDERLLDVDAVICIELIEHLFTNVLEKVPTTVFHYLKPKLAIFTTPNADFNVLFNLKKFRHDDHKFEWTRAEFENWCSSITTKYPDYEVHYDGIGPGPEETEHLGCCSQMAIFSLKNDPLRSYSQRLSTIGKPYKLLQTVVYPSNEDKRNEHQKFLDDIVYEIRKIAASKAGENFQRFDSLFEIPIHYLWKYLQKWCSTEEILMNKLISEGYTVEKNCENTDVVVYDYYEGFESETSEESFEETNFRLQENKVEENWDS